MGLYSRVVCGQNPNERGTSECRLLTLTTSDYNPLQHFLWRKPFITGGPTCVVRKGKVFSYLTTCYFLGQSLFCLLAQNWSYSNWRIYFLAQRRLTILLRSAARVSHVDHSGLKTRLAHIYFQTLYVLSVFSLAMSLQLVLEIIATYVLVSYRLADYSLIQDQYQTVLHAMLLCFLSSFSSKECIIRQLLHSVFFQVTL